MPQFRIDRSPDAAKKNPKRARALEPGHVPGHAYPGSAGVIHVRKGTFPEALWSFEVVFQVNPHLPTARKVAEIFEKHHA